jgi:hypothetical protein
MRESRVDRALFSSKAVSKTITPGGKTMATIPMIPVGPVTTLNRSIFLTERGMSGTGGDDFICGHCGHVMLEDFDPSTVRGNPVYQCGICENNNKPPIRRGRSSPLVLMVKSARDFPVEIHIHRNLGRSL